MTIEPPVYLDHNGTTPVDPRVLGAMIRWLGPAVGNASASNDHGLRARASVGSSSAELAASAGGGDVVFTSGATESVNLALKGAVDRWRSRHGAWPSVVVTAVEHPAVMVACVRDTESWLTQISFTVARPMVISRPSMLYLRPSSAP